MNFTNEWKTVATLQFDGFTREYQAKQNDLGMFGRIVNVSGSKKFYGDDFILDHVTLRKWQQIGRSGRYA